MLTSLFLFLGANGVFHFSTKFSLIPSKSDFPSLAEAFRTGNFVWNDFLIYGLYLIQLLVLFAGVQMIIGLIMAGYTYIFGSVMEDKEKGRDAIKHNFIGFALVVLAWTIVDIIISFLT